MERTRREALVNLMSSLNCYQDPLTEDTLTRTEWEDTIDLMFENINSLIKWVQRDQQNKRRTSVATKSASLVSIANRIRWRDKWNGGNRCSDNFTGGSDGYISLTTLTTHNKPPGLGNITGEQLKDPFFLDLSLQFMFAIKETTQVLERKQVDPSIKGKGNKDRLDNYCEGVRLLVRNS